MDDPYRGRIPEGARSFGLAAAAGEPLSPREITHWRMGAVQEAPRWGAVEALANTTDPSALVRTLALDQLRLRWPEDPRTAHALITSLATDPVPENRVRSARALGFLPGAPEVRAALEEAASIDEDHEVRWAARYALFVRAGDTA